MSRGVFQYEYKLINGLSGDPAVYFFLPTYGRSMLFDLGVLDRISNKELLKVRDVYISHTHIDHFIGFDRFLRVNIPHGRLIAFTGPRGFIKNLESRMKSYTWNLLEPSQIKFLAREVHGDGRVLTAMITNDNFFDPIFDPEIAQPPAGGSVCADIILEDISVQPVVLDHRTDSLGYHLKSPKRYQVNVDAISENGWKPGPWIKSLQKAKCSNNIDKMIEIDDERWSVKELSDKILTELAPFSLSYLTDFVFSRSNIEKIRKLMFGSELLFCESSFRDSDRLRAFEKKHLTTRQCALIGALLCVKKLQCFHISGIYGDNPEEVALEVSSFYDEYSQYSNDRILDEVEKELIVMEKLS
ncbi:MAG: hypothetical protein HQK54_07955 [Oligoflexales bacterium]|nr:hypothetical protein [Oligoflexales bacterium]